MPSAPWLTVEALLVLLAFLALLALALVTSAVLRGGRREDPGEDDADAVSRFTLPVSIIVPMDRPSKAISRTVASLLDLNYPELEVIVVADQPHGDISALRWQWHLSPKEYFYRRSVHTATVHRILESARDPRLIVVEKTPGGRADALNCGLSLARLKYVACVTPGVVLDTNALLRLMAPALRDPVKVVAATSHVERRIPEDGAARAFLVRIWKTAEADWQRIRSLRSWLGSRITISRFRCGLSPSDAVIVWRRDALLETGGFASGASDPALDVLIRLQSEEHGPSGSVILTGEIVGQIEPVGLRASGAAARQRQRAVMEAASGLRQMSADGRVSGWCSVLAELLTPIVQCCAILVVLMGAAVNWFSWVNLGLLLVMLSFGHAAITAASLLLRGAVPDGPGSRELLRLLLLAPAEYVVYRPIVAVARIFDRVFHDATTI